MLLVVVVLRWIFILLLKSSTIPRQRQHTKIKLEVPHLERETHISSPSLQKTTPAKRKIMIFNPFSNFMEKGKRK